MRKERLKNEKNVSFFFCLFVHFSLMIVQILLKYFIVLWKTPPIEKPAPKRNPSIDLQYKSIDWFPYDPSM